jgi:hypothetical protein
LRILGANFEFIFRLFLPPHSAHSGRRPRTRSDRAQDGPSPSVQSATARQTIVRVCHLPRLSSGLPPSYAAFVLFRQPPSRFPAVGEKDAQPLSFSPPFNRKNLPIRQTISHALEKRHRVPGERAARRRSTGSISNALDKRICFSRICDLPAARL